MMDHNGFAKKLHEEVLTLNDIKAQLDSKEKNWPEGSLHILKQAGKKPQFYHYTGEGKRKYIPKNDLGLIQALAQKDYEKHLLTLVAERQKCARNLEKSYAVEETELYHKLSDERKKLVTPLYSTDEDYIDAWYRKHPGFQNPYPYQTTIYSERDELMRSKSEKILADMFLKHGVPYVYEPRLELKNGKNVRILYPDFLLLNVPLRKTIVFEHFGIMDDSDYTQKVMEKINLYEANGFWPGEQLLFTMESKDRPVNIKLVEKMIKKYLI